MGGKSVPRCFFKKQEADKGQGHHCTALGTFPVILLTYELEVSDKFPLKLKTFWAGNLLTGFHFLTKTLGLL